MDEIVATAPTPDLDETWEHGPETGQEFTRNTTIGIQRPPIIRTLYTLLPILVQPLL